MVAILIEYASEYARMRFSIPKIYPSILNDRAHRFTKAEKDAVMAKGVRWYVYYSFEHNGKMIRQNPIYLSINRRFERFEDRLRHIHMIRDAQERLLRRGYSPYREHATLADDVVQLMERTASEIAATLSDTYRADFTSRVHGFISHCRAQGVAMATEIDMPLFRGWIMERYGELSARSFNNAKAAVSMLLKAMVEAGHMARNVAADLPKRKERSRRDRTYTDEQVERIAQMLYERDGLLLLFVKMVGFMFWRPVEVVRIKASDIDWAAATVTVRTKTEGTKTKRIPDLLYEELRDYTGGGTGYLFTPNGVGEWDATEVSRRNYFTKRFARAKGELAIGKGYSLYSFRHYYSTKLYKNLLAKMGNHEAALGAFMQISGHTSRQGAMAYIHSIDAALPDDYSHLLR